MCGNNRTSGTLIDVLLAGDAVPATRSKPTGLRMATFETKLDDAQIADIITYIRNAWGNHASTVSASDVSSLRKRKSPGG